MGGKTDFISCHLTYSFIQAVHLIIGLFIIKLKPEPPLKLHQSQ